MSKLKVFVSYAHEDASYKNELIKHCSLLVENEKIEIWTDDNIRAGNKFDDRIKNEIESCHMSILLLSSTYWSKEYIKDTELPLIIEHERSRDITVIPIIINGERKIKYSPLNGRTLIPTENNMLKAIEDFENQEKAWDIIFDEIDKSLEEYEKKKIVEQSTAVKKETKKSEYLKKVAILSASPIKEKSWYDIDEIFEMFGNFDIELEYLVLNEENLYALDDFESVFIFAQTNKIQIIIEDEYFMSKTIDIEEMKEIFKSYENDNIHIFTFENTMEKISDFIYLENIKKDLRKFIHDTYRKLFKKGTCRLERNITEISSNFKSTKKLKDFVGRENDIRNIIRDILELQKSEEVYTILGSGGIGKTTLLRKVIQELSIRAKFKDGIQFIDCEFLKDYVDFEQKVAIAFDMTNVLNFKAQLEEQKETHRLIILDNVETLLYVERSSDVKEIKELIDFISEYSTIVITSREKLDNGNEKLYSLTDLQLDDAELLFIKKSNILPLDKEDRKFLRDTILDELLSKNPLAIELVAGLRLNIYDLEKELRDNFFDTTKDKTIESVFANQSDFNIVKSKSLFHSIRMSYKGLEEKHRLMFELLSLFPDGLHKKNFITFFNSDKQKNNNYKITYIDINTLEDKSIININDEYVKLQSIIGRFAQHMFDENNTQKDYYYQEAYSYNNFILDEIQRTQKKNNPLSVSFLIKNKNNFIRSLDYLHLIEFNENTLIYIDSVIGFFGVNTSPDGKLINKLYDLKNKFTHFDDKALFFDSVIFRLKYYYGEFATTYQEIKEKYSLEKLLKNNSNSLVTRISLNNLYVIHGMEGMQYNLLTSNLQLDTINYKGIDWKIFFSIGEYKICHKLYNKKKISNENEDKFFQYELELNTNNLNIDEVKLELSRLYKTQYLSKVELTYSSFKYNKNDVSLMDIENLIVTNPYTYGLKTLMKAIKDEQSSSKFDYEEAIKNLYHIRYYYTEGVLHYCKYLRDSNDEEYARWLKKGRDLANKHHYRFLLHQFICLETDIFKEYNEYDYSLPEKLDYAWIIKKYKLKGLS
ncbi:MAG: TIR domain-containing protein [Sulfurimonas sp.]|jgi:hypothetical protein